MCMAFSTWKQILALKLGFSDTVYQHTMDVLPFIAIQICILQSFVYTANI